MKRKLTFRRFLITMTDTMFAAYAVYNIFILIKDGKRLSLEGKFISVVLALIFAVFAFFVWTAGVNQKSIRFMAVRRILFIVALVTVLLIKLRMIGSVIDYIDSSYPETVLYGLAYFTSLSAMLILNVYYLFILRDLPSFPKASVLLPVSAIILFAISLIVEFIVFFVFNIGIEESALRNIVMRPVFYLGFIGLSAFFLYPPQLNANTK